jgi:enoyl-CoA hydratase/carnithine racemase
MRRAGRLFASSPIRVDICALFWLTMARYVGFDSEDVRGSCLAGHLWFVIASGEWALSLLATVRREQRRRRESVSHDGTTSAPPLLVQRTGAVATFTINDAPRNRMSLDFIDALEIEVDRVSRDSSVRAIVIRGAGDENFSVGMNLKQLPKGIERMGSPEALFDQRLRVLDAIENLPKPVIALLYGYCLGGGLELPLSCHFRLAAKEGARIGLPELDLGTVPAWGGSARLTRCVGRDHALDMILRAKKISGPEALRIGLVNEVWPLEELFQRAQDLALELAEMPSAAVAGMLRCIVGADEKTLAESISEERAAVMATMGTPDQREGMMAFLEKRKPRFNRES